jgi:hypothetical protein
MERLMSCLMSRQSSLLLTSILFGLAFSATPAVARMRRPCVRTRATPNLCTPDAAPFPSIVLADSRAAASKSHKPVAAPVPPNSGVYGYVGTTALRGAIGKCVWIYDASNQKQVAVGRCSTKHPGKYRVPLAPGHYVLKGPGGTKTILVKRHAWTHVNSLFDMPGGNM